jgi:hypothetical protein
VSARARLARVAALACLAASAAAHDGPPYPILVDEPTVAGELSVWADPDVGVGTFYLYLEAGWSERAPLVRLSVRPVDGHRDESVHATEPALPGAPFQLLGRVPFDATGAWYLRLELEGRAGRTSVERTIEVTPPGPGAIGLVWFLVPFLALGGLWGRLLLKRSGGAGFRPS